MLAAMVCALGLTLLAIQVAQANDLRTKAQTAADAAAIGSLTSLRDAGISSLQLGDELFSYGLWTVDPNQNDPDPTYYKDARKYADRNQADVPQKPHPSGERGFTMSVTVRTQECQKATKSQENGGAPFNTQLCRGKDGKPILDGNGQQIHGLQYTATSIAKLIPPTCTDVMGQAPLPPGGSDSAPIRVGLDCRAASGGDTVRVWNLNGPSADSESIIRLFEIRLVSAEDPTAYNGPLSIVGPHGPYPVPGNLPPGTPDMIKKVLAYAEAQLGTPYYYGGTCTNPQRYYSPTNCDCSSLAQMSYAAAGVSLPRTADAQWFFTAGNRIPAGQEKAGDLVFFEMGPSGPGHVGIVVDPASHTMIEAPHTGDVVKFYSYDGNIGFGRPYR